MTTETAMLQVAAADHRLMRAALQDCLDALEAAKTVDMIRNKHNPFWIDGGGARALNRGKSMLRGVNGNGQ